MCFCAGKIDEILFRPTSKVWGYFSVTSDGGIHEFSDSQFGHLFAKGGTRNEAISAMVTALKELKIRGEIRTTVEYVTTMIQDPDFLSQRIHTAWLDRRIAMQVSSSISKHQALNGHPYAFQLGPFEYVDQFYVSSRAIQGIAHNIFASLSHLPLIFHLISYA